MDNEIEEPTECLSVATAQVEPTQNDATDDNASAATSSGGAGGSPPPPASPVYHFLGNGQRISQLQAANMRSVQAARRIKVENFQALDKSCICPDGAHTKAPWWTPGETVRLVHCFTSDEVRPALSRALTGQTRSAMDAEGGPSALPGLYEVVTSVFNGADIEVVPDNFENGTESFDGEFPDAQDPKHWRFVDTIKQKTRDLKRDITQCNNNYIKSGQNDPSKRPDFVPQGRRELLYCWLYMEKHDLMGMVTRTMPAAAQIETTLGPASAPANASANAPVNAPANAPPAAPPDAPPAAPSNARAAARSSSPSVAAARGAHNSTQRSFDDYWAIRTALLLGKTEGAADSGSSIGMAEVAHKKAKLDIFLQIVGAPGCNEETKDRVNAAIAHLVEQLDTA